MVLIILKKYNFVKVEFKNMMAFNKVKNFWYTNHKNFTKRSLERMDIYLSAQKQI